MQNRKVYETVLFDLDGTLTDSKLGIARSVNHALRSFGLEEKDLNSLEKYVGPPLKYSFMTFCGLDAEKAEEAIKIYREYYSVKGMYENEVYPGIPELLESLKTKGKTLAVATSKATVYAKKILEYFKLADYFTLIAGSNLDGSRANKDEVVIYALDELHLNPQERVVLVGDKNYDIMGARKAGIDSIGVLYGYGSLEELQSENPTHLVKTVEDLGRLLVD